MRKNVLQMLKSISRSTDRQTDRSPLFIYIHYLACLLAKCIIFFCMGKNDVLMTSLSIIRLSVMRLHLSRSAWDTFSHIPTELFKYHEKWKESSRACGFGNESDILHAVMICLHFMGEGKGERMPPGCHLLFISCSISSFNWFHVLQLCLLSVSRKNQTERCFLLSEGIKLVFGVI